jgi:hypothetical protein
MKRRVLLKEGDLGLWNASIMNTSEPKTVALMDSKLKGVQEGLLIILWDVVLNQPHGIIYFKGREKM